MTIDATEAFTILAHIATTAQTSGLVPGGTPALVLAAIVAGLQATLQSGVLRPQVLRPQTPIEINDVGDELAAAIARFRAAEPR